MRLPTRQAIPATVSPIGPATSVVDETTFGRPSVVGTGLRFARDDHSHGTPTVSMGGIYTWAAKSNIIAPQSNPSAKSWIYALKTFLPLGMTMTGYGLSLATPGAKTDGYVRFGVWTGSAANAYPIAEYEAARVLFWTAGKPAGWSQPALQARGVSSLNITPGWSWIIAVIERWGARVEAPIDWWDAVSNNGMAWGIELTGLAGWPFGTWDTADSVAQTKVPGISIVG